MSMGVWRRFAAARARDEQSGSVTPFVLIVTIALLMLGGLVIDGGRQLNSKSRAMAYAQEATRAGAQTIDLEKDQAILVPADAIEAASRFCAQAMAEDPNLTKCTPGTYSSTDPASDLEVVNVTVDTVVETDGILSGMFGVNTWTAEGTAVARPVQGTTEMESGQEQELDPPTTKDPTDTVFPTDGPEEPTDDPYPCESPYYDPYDPTHTWEPGDPRLDPPITEESPTEQPVPCWPPWTPPPPKDDKPKCDDPPKCKPPEGDDPPNCDDPPKCDKQGDDNGNGNNEGPQGRDEQSGRRPDGQ